MLNLSFLSCMLLIIAVAIWFKKKNDIGYKIPLDWYEDSGKTLFIKLHCPDGLYETRGYDLPEQLDDFLKFINTYSSLVGYSIEAERYNTAKAWNSLLEKNK